jgi:hypothetical protein
MGPSPYGPLPDFIIRPVNVRDEVVKNIYRVCGDIAFAEISLQDDKDWPRFAESLGLFFEFPSGVEHSFGAMRDWLTDLSWLENRHYVYIADISNLNTSSGLIYDALDTVLHSLVESALDPKAKITFVLLI